VLISYSADINTLPSGHYTKLKQCKCFHVLLCIRSTCGTCRTTLTKARETVKDHYHSCCTSYVWPHAVLVYIVHVTVVQLLISIEPRPLAIMLHQ